MRLSGTNLERAGDHNQRVTLACHPRQRPDHARRARDDHRAHLAGHRQHHQAAAHRQADPGRRTAARRPRPAGHQAGHQPGQLVFHRPQCRPRSHHHGGAGFRGPRARARLARSGLRAARRTSSSSSARASANYSAKVGIGRERLVGIGVALPDDMPRAATLPHQPANYGVWASTDVASLLREYAERAGVRRERRRRRHHGRNAVRPRQEAPDLFLHPDHGGARRQPGDRRQSFSRRHRPLAASSACCAAAMPPATSARSRTSCRCRRCTAGSRRRAFASRRRTSSPISTRAARPSSTPGSKPRSTRCIDTVLAINCLVNPEAVLIGGRLPAGIVDQLATRLNQRLEALCRQRAGDRAGGARRVVR